MSQPAVAIVGFPTDVNSSFKRGPAKAPNKIRAEMFSAGGNSFTEAGFDLAKRGVMHDYGDATLEETESDLATIERTVDAHLVAGRRVLSLGGDHSVTYPIVRAYARHFSELRIVHFDAHPDLYPEFQGNRYSHASPFARIVEDTSVAQLLQIGIRTMSARQEAMAKRYGVSVFSPYRLEDAIRSLPSGNVYVSLDLDGLDPAFAPGVSHREPGGLTVREVLDIVNRIPGKVVGADVVELNPDEDVRDVTAAVAAKFAKEFASRVARDAGIAATA